MPPTRCPECGLLRGCAAPGPLSDEMRYALLDAGYKLAVNAIGEEIASRHDEDQWNCAWHHWCRLGHPKPRRPTWYQRVLTDGIEDPEPSHVTVLPKYHEDVAYYLHFQFPDGRDLDYGPWSGVPSDQCRFSTYDEVMYAADKVRALYGADVVVGVIVQQTSVRVAPYDAWDKVLDSPLDHMST